MTNDVMANAAMPLGLRESVVAAATGPCQSGDTATNSGKERRVRDGESNSTHRKTENPQDSPSEIGTENTNCRQLSSIIRKWSN